MKTTLKQQQAAIMEAMNVQVFRVWLQRGGTPQSSLPDHKELMKDKQYRALNDAASTIATLKIAEDLRKKHDRKNR